MSLFIIMKFVSCFLLSWLSPIFIPPSQALVISFHPLENLILCSQVKMAHQTYQGEVVKKPWGYELIWAHTPRYVGKILHINKGESLSYQYHRVKDETVRLLSGSLEMEVELAGERTRLK